MTEEGLEKDWLRVDALRLPRTKAALEVYDRAKAAYQAAAGSAPLKVLQRLDVVWDSAGLEVKMAFAQETADRNQTKNALLVSPEDPWLRRLVGRYG